MKDLAEIWLQQNDPLYNKKFENKKKKESVKSLEYPYFTKSQLYIIRRDKEILVESLHYLS